MNDVIELLEHDYRAIEDLLETVMTGKYEPLKEEALASLEGELEAHIVAEEQTVYPRLREDERFKELITRSQKDHREVRKLLRRARDFSSAEHRGAFLEELRLALDHHIGHEESRLFPAMRESLEPLALRRLASAFTRAKVQQAKAS